MKRRVFFVILIIVLMMLSLAGCSKETAEEYGVNLLKDGDFENDLYDNWDKDVWVKIDGYSGFDIVNEDGNNVLRINSNELNDAKMKQTVKVEEKQTYRLSGYIKADEVTAGSGANLSFENMFFYTAEQYNTNGQYVYVELYGKTVKDQDTLTVFVRLGGYSSESKGTAYFDNIKLEKIENAPDGAIVYQLEETKPQKTTTKIEDEDKVKFSGWMVIISILFIIAFALIKQSLDYGNGLEKDRDGKLNLYMFGLIMFIGLLIRAILAVSVAGYPNDIGCWIGWSSVSADKGIIGLYDGQTFIDYPPGYMYILYIIGLINKIPGLAGQAAAIVKIPPILADAAMAVVIYKLANDKISNRAALLLSSLYFMSPAIITDSAAWGQIDSLLTLMVLGYVIYLNKRKFVAAGILLGTGVLIKPQMGLFVFVYIAALIYYFIEYKPRNKKGDLIEGFDAILSKGGKTLVELIKGTAAGVGAFVIISLPLIIKYGFMFMVDMFVDILSSYSSVSLNACNIWPLLGGMWEKVDTPLWGATYSFWGGVGFVIAVIIFFIAALKDKNRKNLLFHAALLITGLFMLAGKMHERYMYPAMALLLVSYIYTKNRKHMALFGIFTVTQFANTSLVLANQYMFGIKLSDLLGSMKGMTSLSAWFAQYNMNLWTTVISFTALAGFIYMLYVGLKPVDEDRQKHIEEIIRTDREISRKNKKNRITDRIKSAEYEGLFKSLSKKDYIFMFVITLIYSVIAFINLGNNYGPETMWNVNSSNQEVVVDFGQQVDIDKVMFFRAQGTNGANFTISFSDTNEEDDFYTSYFYKIDEEDRLEDLRDELVEEYDIVGENLVIKFSNYPAIFKWYTMDGQDTARYAKIKINRPMIRLVEMVFIDDEGDTIPIKDVIITDGKAQDAMLMFDEQETVPKKTTYMNSTYFDEIYHAGTAWEHLMRYEPYETTHPPLGKVIMSLGIKTFGMNPFGWRFMGTIVGILMIPAMYLLAMVIFKKTRYAAIAAILMTFDFMHFTQTRIATIDSYGVFFIILMFLCMGIYYRMSFYKSSLIKTLIPLGLSGIFFGLGAASKWICLYAGAGLAIVFFYTLFKRYREYRAVYTEDYGNNNIDNNIAEHIKRKYRKYTLITLAFCIIFFIVIPVIIYSASYIPIMQAEEGRGLEYVLDSQKYMYNYHSNLDATHGFQSPWYEWPLIIKPMWYYSDSTLYGTGQMTSIAAFGNPAVWWMGTIAFIWLIISMFKNKKEHEIQRFVMLGFLAQYLPWTLVPRSMFIYHYFASIPFIILMITMMIRNFENREFKITKIISSEIPKDKLSRAGYKLLTAVSNNRDVIVYAYLTVVILFFIMFYPVIAGMQIPSAYGQFLKWMPTWWFFY